MNAHIFSPRRYMTRGLVVLVCGGGAATALGAVQGPDQSAEARDGSRRDTVAIIRSYNDGLRGVRAANPNVHLAVGRDPALPDEPVLLVEYPAPTGDPAGRDVQCEAETKDWSAGRAIAFQINPEHAVRLSVSFVDRNRVAYTAWVDLVAGRWQSVRLPFFEMRPNPYFQPPEAKTGTSLDVSDVKAIGFAPQDRMAGRLAISRFVIQK